MTVYFLRGTGTDYVKIGYTKASHSTKRHFVRAVILVFWLLVSIAVIASVIFAWHFLAPPKWGFLSEQQLEKIQTMLFSGAGVGLAGFVSKKYLT